MVTIESLHCYYFSVRLDGFEKDNLLNTLKSNEISNHEKNTKYLYNELYKRFNHFFRRLIDDEKLIIHNIKYYVFLNQYSAVLNEYDSITIFYVLDYYLKETDDAEAIKNVLTLTNSNFIYKQSYLKFKINNVCVYNSEVGLMDNYSIKNKKDKEKIEKLISITDELTILNYAEKERFKIYLIENDDVVSKFLLDNLLDLLKKQKDLYQVKSKEIIKTKTFLFKKLSFSKSINVETSIEDNMNNEFTRIIEKIDSWSQLTNPIPLGFSTEKSFLEDRLIKLQKDLSLSIRDNYTIFHSLIIDDFDSKMTKLVFYLTNINYKEDKNYSLVFEKVNEVLNNFDVFYKEYNKVIQHFYTCESLSNNPIEEENVLDKLNNLKF